MRTKTFKCSICKNINPIIKIDGIDKKVDIRKYIACKLVCGSCWYRNNGENRLRRKKISYPYIYLNISIKIDSHPLSVEI